MSVSAARFEFALSNVRSQDWAAFERLSSAFLIADYPNVRTTATTSGDKGRDAELFSTQDFPTTMFQFSVQKDWPSKISLTLKTLADNFPEYDTLVFLTNHQIGAKGDGWKTKARADGVVLDIRDQNWFIDRFELDSGRTKAAENFSNLIADPLLRTGIETSTSALVGQEARTALTYLEMQAKDENAAKGLTKSCFDALVRCALRDTSAEKRMPRAEVHSKIAGLLPQHPIQQLVPLIDSALLRLAKGAVKISKTPDEFHISFEEVAATKEKVAAMNLLILSFNNDVEEILQADAEVPTGKYSQLTALVRNVIEVYFFRLGEEFVHAIANGSDLVMDYDVLNAVVQDRVSGPIVYKDKPLGEFVKKIAADVLATPSPATKEFLRLLSTAYTLFAFLSEVPDVQKATKKLFEHATIWLDTTAILPVIAEMAFTEDNRPFTDMYRQLRRAGSKLVVTQGVLDEVLGHLNNSKACSQKTSWTGRMPYVFVQYMLSGRAKDRFAAWVENFIGDHRPTDDIAAFLDEHEILLTPAPDFSTLEEGLVSAVRDYWHDVHDKRRKGGFSIYAHELAENDAENYLSPIAQRRATRGITAFGYNSWYLTLDTLAWRLKDSVDTDTKRKIGHAPLISLDFLIKYLTFGPRRDQVDTSGLGWSRIFTDDVLLEAPEDLAIIATQVRVENSDKPERIIQRRIRDELDRQRGLQGPGQRAGLEGSNGAFTGK